MRSRLSISLLIALHASAVAQTPAPRIVAPTIDAKSPAECTKGLNDWRTSQLVPARAALRNATGDARADAGRAYDAAYEATTAEAVRAAKECALKFDVAKIASAQLVDLIGVYNFARDTSGRRRATERLLGATDLSPRQHAQALSFGMSDEIARSGSYFGIIEGAERTIARIDALPDSLADVKLAAHQSMLGRYEYLDVNEGLRTHALAMITLGRKLKNEQAVLFGYSSLARSAADRLQPDSALKLLDVAEKEIGTEKAAPTFKDFRDRYALIGTKAAPITGEWWLNVNGTPAPVQPGDGKVRLVEFTAHWCVPCKNSYPGLRALADRFRGQEFEGVMVTSLFGYVGTQRNLTAEQEVAADREYYTHEHALPFKVAINPLARDGVKVDRDYRVGGIPQIVIVDRRGVIRQIVIGWDHGNTQRIGDLIARLLKEPTA